MNFTSRGSGCLLDLTLRLQVRPFLLRSPDGRLANASLVGFFRGIGLYMGPSALIVKPYDYALALEVFGHLEAQN